MNVVIPRPSYNGEDVPGLGMVNSLTLTYNKVALEAVYVLSRWQLNIGLCLYCFPVVSGTCS